MIYDCFLFCHELDLLELRFSILETVDRFVIGEAAQTFMGDAKPLFFKEHRRWFQKWESRIHYVEIPSIGTNDPKTRERFQRDYLKTGLGVRPELAFRPDDLVFLNDVDEIPDVSRVQTFLTEHPARGCFKIDPYWSSLFLNWRVTDQSWPHMRVVTGDVARDRSMSQIRWGAGTAIPDGGWHFQNTGGAASIEFKCRSFCHAADYDEQSKKLWHSAEAMERKINEMKEQATNERRGFCHPVKILGPDDPAFPEYVRTHWDALKAKGLIYE